MSPEPGPLHHPEDSRNFPQIFCEIVSCSLICARGALSVSFLIACEHRVKELSLLPLPRLHLRDKAIFHHTMEGCQDTF